MAKPIAANNRTDPKDKPKKVVFMILLYLIFCKEADRDLLASDDIFIGKESSSAILFKIFTKSLFVFPDNFLIALILSESFPYLEIIEYLAISKDFKISRSCSSFMRSLIIIRIHDFL